MLAEKERDYKEITVKLTLPKDWLRKLDTLIDKRIFSSRAGAFRRSLELLFEKYQAALGNYEI